MELTPGISSHEQAAETAPPKSAGRGLQSQAAAERLARRPDALLQTALGQQKETREGLPFGLLEPSSASNSRYSNFKWPQRAGAGRNLEHESWGPSGARTFGGIAARGTHVEQLLQMDGDVGRKARRGASTSEKLGAFIASVLKGAATMRSPVVKRPLPARAAGRQAARLDTFTRQVQGSGDDALAWMRTREPGMQSAGKLPSLQPLPPIPTISLGVQNVLNVDKLDRSANAQVFPMQEQLHAREAGDERQQGAWKLMPSFPSPQVFPKPPTMLADMPKVAWKIPAVEVPVHSSSARLLL